MVIWGCSSPSQPTMPGMSAHMQTGVPRRSSNSSCTVLLDHPGHFFRVYISEAWLLYIKTGASLAQRLFCTEQGSTERVSHVKHRACAWICWRERHMLCCQKEAGSCQMPMGALARMASSDNIQHACSADLDKQREAFQGIYVHLLGISQRVL